MPSAWNKIYCRTLFTENGIYYPAAYGMRTCTSPAAVHQGGKMYSVHRPWHNYLQRAGSITNNKNKRETLRRIIPLLNPCSMLTAGLAL